jgi:hypothetical protein
MWVSSTAAGTAWPSVAAGNCKGESGVWYGTKLLIVFYRSIIQVSDEAIL